MKLNYKRTVLVGLAFLSISAFWQMYDSVVPLILANNFQLDESITGMIMAADNVLALFLLPLFGGISDKVKTPIGRRMPFVLGGTAVAVVLMNILPRLANSYFGQPTLGTLVAFIIVLGLLLIAMGTYRSPAVALMPDVTPKPLRSKANAIINLMGAVGGLVYLAVTAVLYSKSRIAQYYTIGTIPGEDGIDVPVVNYTVLFAVVACVMVAAVAALLLTIRENKLRALNLEYEAAHPEENLTQTNADGAEEMPKEVKRSMAFLLVSIALWFIGYNGVTTWFSTYVSRVMGEGIGTVSTCLMVGTVSAIISYLPIGIIASRIGRKKTIMAGIVLLTGAFVGAFFATINATTITPIMYVLFALVGLAWAAIGVNSLPMVVEMCKGSEVGKFTGYYYTFSMIAQVVTPTVAGNLLKISYKLLFPYAAVFVGLAFFTMSQVKHGDNKVEEKKGLEAFDIED